MSVAGLQDQLVRANNGYRAHFVEQLRKTEAEWMPLLSAITMEIPSMGPSEEHNFGEAAPKMTEWVGDREIGRLGLDGFTLKNKNYANGVEIDRNDLEDDRLGLYVPQIRAMAEEGTLSKVDLLRDLLNGAFADLCYDGQAFFANAHPLSDSSSTNDNLITGVLSNDNYRSACTQLRELKDSRGRYLRMAATHLIVGNDNEWTAKEILNQERLATGETNIARGTAQLLVLPGLTSTNWIVADLGKVLKPIIFQNRRGIQFTEVEDASSPEVFMRRFYQYGADWRGALGYALYQCMVGSEG